MSETEHETDPAPEPKLAGILTFPPEVVAALDEHCAVERLPRDRAICEIVAEYLRFKGYLRTRPAHPHRRPHGTPHGTPHGEKPEGL